MALQVQMVVSENKMIGEKIVSPRLVNLQSLAFDDFCDFVAQGSTVTAADVSAVMKQLEKNIPFILSLNTKVNVSPEGLVFRPSVKGSITQSQLAAKLSARRQAYLDAGDTESAEKINVNRALESADLSVNDLQACIVIDLPKRWDTRFKQQVEFKRVTKGASMMSDSETGDDTTYTLSVSTANPAMGTVDTSVNKSYAPGTQVTVKATPASGYAFDQWSDGNTSATRTLTMNSNLNLVASFKTSTSSGSGSDEEDVETYLRIPELYAEEVSQRRICHLSGQHPGISLDLQADAEGSDEDGQNHQQDAHGIAPCRNPVESPDRQVREDSENQGGRYLHQAFKSESASQQCNLEKYEKEVHHYGELADGPDMEAENVESSRKGCHIWRTGDRGGAKVGFYGQGHAYSHEREPYCAGKIPGNQ